MRKGNEPSFIQHENTILGVSLGADFTAEHECGIAEMKKLLGIPMGEKDWGIKRRQVTNVPGKNGFGWTT